MVLFITRKHPPSVGGMQALSFGMIQAVGKLMPSFAICWSGEPVFLLPAFYVYAFARALYVLLSRQVSLVHVSDPVLAPLGWLLRSITKVPVAVNAHGLDVVYPCVLYGAVMLPFLTRLDRVICISEHTRQLCLDRGVVAERTCVIPVGANPADFDASLALEARQEWLQELGVDNDQTRPIMITVGRLVPRKGVKWFVSEVLPLLHQRDRNWLYLVIGDGPEREDIQGVIEMTGLGSCVRTLGPVSRYALRMAYAAADVFVMPNVPIPGTLEGFGVVSLEARLSGARVVATSLEGIGDAFGTGDDSLLVSPLDAVAMTEALIEALHGDLSVSARQSRRALTAKRFSWDAIARMYAELFEQLGSRGSGNVGGGVVRH